MEFEMTIMLFILVQLYMQLGKVMKSLTLGQNGN